MHVVMEFTRSKGQTVPHEDEETRAGLKPGDTARDHDVTTPEDTYDTTRITDSDESENQQRYIKPN